MSKTLIEHSKTLYTSTSDRASVEEINAGSMQRIAAATEAMSANFLQLQRDLEYYRKRTIELTEKNRQKDATIKALRGHVTRLKNQAKKKP